MRYKNYEGKVEFDEDARIFHGEVVGTKDVITFQGTSVDELEKAFHDSVDDYLDWCAARGKEPNKPFSGKIPFRTTPDLHRYIFEQAKRHNASMNTWIEKMVEDFRDHHPLT